MCKVSTYTLLCREREGGRRFDWMNGQREGGTKGGQEDGKERGILNTCGYL